MKRPLILIFCILLIDQISKFWIKTNMYLGQEFNVLGDWFIIHFTENPGMAFGLELGGSNGKVILTLFRICVAIFGFWYLHKLTKEKSHPGLITCGALILAGAVGNIIDSIFYGKIFSESYGALATFLPEEGGYAGFLHGHVVDMLYFPIIDTQFPSWFPFWANEDFLFFRPVFNVADSSITIGVSLILIFQKKFFNQDITEEKPAETQAQQET